MGARDRTDALFVDFLEGGPGDPSAKLLHEDADGQGVVPECGPGLPERPHLRELGGGQLGVVVFLEGKSAFDSQKTGLVGEQLGHGNGGLSFGAEFRPVLDHFSVKVQEAVLDQKRDDQPGHSLGTGENTGYRIRAAVRAAADVQYLDAAVVGRKLG
ncbi:hypothetical protein AHiyo1_25650 [Arthrobacter sp. Hiyo1]|nr:hypothetical protein AHiyo1_25650 [Arthrobacter sp. Hiyo1]